jgi:fatty-acyl-CoA synthase
MTLLSERQASMTSPPLTLNDLGSVVRLNARRSPTSPAVIEADGRRRTYAELDDRSARLANALRGLGLAPGDRIAGWMGDVVEYVEFYVAAAKAGLVVVPINNRFTTPEATFQLERTEARAIAFTPELRERVAQVPGIEDLLTIPVLDEATGPTEHGWESLIESASDTPLEAPNPRSPFMICFTSGTSGRPKGAVLTHRSVMILAATQLAALRIPIGGVNLAAVSMSFPATVCSHLVSHVLSGGAQVLAAASWDSDRLLDLIERERATHIYVPGPALVEFSEVAEAAPERWRSLRSVLHAGSRADPATLRRFADVMGSRYTEGWGMTEISGGLATATVPNDLLRHADNFFTKAGRPVPGTMVQVVDGDRNPLPPGSEGEFALYSASLFAGYWNDAQATADAVVDGWYYSGDIGSIDEDGYVSITDRRTNMIISGGMNIYPAEVELTIARCPGVAECAVVGEPHERWGQVPLAVVVRVEGEPVSEEAVISFVQGELASYKKPHRVIFVDELPRTTGGKLARGVLRDQVQALLEDAAPGGST